MNDLIEVKNKTVLDAFISKKGLDPILKEATDIVTCFEHDMTSLKGRNRTKALANNIAKFKVRVDDLGKGLTEEWRQQTKLVNDSRAKIRASLEDLKIVARQPLTEWEDTQAKIEQDRAEKEAAEKAAVQFEADHEIGILLNEKHNRDAEDAAQKAAEEAAAALAIEEKKQAERYERIASEAVELAKKKAKKKAKREEEERKQAEKNRIADQKAKDANAKAELDRQKAATAKAEKDAAESDKRALEAESLAKENSRKEQEATLAEEARQAQLREADKKNRAKIVGEAVSGLVDAGIQNKVAKLVVEAISEKKVPHLLIVF